MSETYKGTVRYETSFDLPTDTDKIVCKTVCRKHTRWVVDGRILEPGDPAEPRPQTIFRGYRPSLLSLGVT